MKYREVLFAMLMLSLSGCTTMRILNGEEAALYSIVNAEGFIVPITYEYSVVRKVDGTRVQYNENPVFISQGKHQIEIEYGKCFAPVLIILCEFQPSRIIIVEQTFTGGKRYTLTLNKGKIVEI